MSLKSIKDRIPFNVLDNGAIRYGIYDQQGTLKHYDFIKREDEPLEEGTPINKALFDNFQGDLYTQDRYNLLRVTSEETKKLDINGFVEKTTIGHDIKAVATDGNGLYVGVGTGGYIATSTDLINWTQQASGQSIDLYDVAYGDGVFIAVGDSQLIIKSSDGGVTWTKKYMGSSSSYDAMSVAYGNGGFMVGSSAQNIARDHNLWYSTDGGETWEGRDVGNGTATLYVTYLNDQFIVASGTAVYTSSTANNTLTTMASGITAFNSQTVYDIIYAKGYYVVAGYSTVAISEDLRTWTQISTDRVNTLIENDGQILMGLENGYLKATEDFEYIQTSASAPSPSPIVDFLKVGDKIIFFTYTITGIVYESTKYLNEYKQHLNIPLTSYEKGKIVNIEGGRIFEPKDFETVTENLFPEASDFTSNSQTKYTSSEGFVLISTGGQNLLNSIDDSVSTDWQDSTSNLATQWIRMEVPNQNGYKITKMKLKAGWSGQSSQRIAIEGSFDGNTWTDLFVWTGLGITVDEDNIELNNTDFYKYYRVSVVLNTGATQGKAVIYDWKVREYLQVLSVGDQYVTSFYNPKLNINNLGEKQINATINYGEKYSLVYNGESWDVAGAKTVTGKFSAERTLQTINLGFTPDLVILYVPNNNDTKVAGGTTTDAGFDYIPRILTKAYSSANNGAIVEGGFTYLVTVSATVYYIAINF